MVGNGSTFSDAQWQQYLLEVCKALHVLHYTIEYYTANA
jgi:hypothetical protein